jgi:hypothetical protein
MPQNKQEGGMYVELVLTMISRMGGDQLATGWMV